MVGLSSEDVDLLIIGDGRVLEPAIWCESECFDGPTPLELVEVKHEQVVEPELAVAASKDEHLIVDDTRSVKLTHWCLAFDDAWNVEDKLVHSLLEINEDDVGEHLESVPPAVNDDLAAIPDLTRVAHSGLGQLLLVDLWLGPILLLYNIRNKKLETTNHCLIIPKASLRISNGWLG